MGEDVKITVIATGFATRCRAPCAHAERGRNTGGLGTCSGPGQLAARNRACPEPAPASARFMGQDEDAAADEAFFYSSAMPAVATTVTVAGGSAKPDAGVNPDWGAA